MVAIQITMSSQLQTYISLKDLKITWNIYVEMLEDGAKFFRIPILFSWLHLNNFVSCIINIGVEL